MTAHKTTNSPSSDIAALADRLVTTSEEFLRATQAIDGYTSKHPNWNTMFDRLVKAEVALEDAIEDYTFMRHEMKVRVAREPR